MVSICLHSSSQFLSCLVPSQRKDLGPNAEVLYVDIQAFSQLIKSFAGTAVDLRNLGTPSARFNELRPGARITGIETGEAAKPSVPEVRVPEAKAVETDSRAAEVPRLLCLYWGQIR